MKIRWPSYGLYSLTKPFGQGFRDCDRDASLSRAPLRCYYLIIWYPCAVCLRDKDCCGGWSANKDWRWLHWGGKDKRKRNLRQSGWRNGDRKADGQSKVSHCESQILNSLYISSISPGFMQEPIRQQSSTIVQPCNTILLTKQFDITELLLSNALHTAALKSLE